MIWIKFGLIVIIVFVCIFIVKFFLRRFFKIEKTFFIHQPINELHRTIQIGLGIFATITLIWMNMAVIFDFKSFNYRLIMAIILFAVLDYLLKAFFEWKYSDDPKHAILTMTEMCIILLAIFIVYQYQLLI